MSTDQPIPQEQLEEIDRYLQRTMTTEEERLFVARMTTDAQLKTWTDEMRLLIVGIQETSLQPELDVFHTGIPATAELSKNRTAKIISFKRLVAAASILLIAVLSAWLLFFRTGNRQDVFAHYFYPDPGLASAMGISGDYSFDRAMIDYKTKNYTAAITVWDSLQRKQPANDTLNYFLASAFLANKETDKAITYYKKVIEYPGSSFIDDANWYLGLALLKNGRKEEAITYITKSTHPDKTELLNKLR